MSIIEYQFENVKRSTESKYIFQTVKNRKLSEIYHSHDFYEWIVVVEGSCTQIINEKKIHIDKNVCVLLCPGDRHKYICQSADVNVLSISVEKEEFERFVDVFLGKNELSYFKTVLNLNQIRTLLGFYHASSEEEYKLFLANLIKIYIDTVKDKAEIPYTLKFSVKEMMKPENLRQGITRFTELSGYSKSHLSRLMKKYYSTTLHEFIMNARLEAAYNLLVLTKINMEELAESVGYESFSHFNKIFKAKYGITPAALRREGGLWTI